MDHTDKNTYDMRQNEKQEKIKRPVTEQEAEQITKTLQEGLGETVVIKKGEE